MAGIAAEPSHPRVPAEAQGAHVRVQDTHTGELERLVDRAWGIYRRAEEAGYSFVVRPSIPVLFFGDSEAYFRSPVRIITVGLNPSLQEFPTEKPFLRFPAAGDAFGVHGVSPCTNSASLSALNSYFRKEPYRRWFASYEEILKGAGASYYDGAPSVALHTDFCSVLATDPTWNKLSARSQSALIDEGRGLWHELVRALAPDAILISVAGEHLPHVAFEAVDDWHTAYTVKRENPYHVQVRHVHVVPDKVTTMVFGRASQLPFGTVSGDERRMIGEVIRRSLDGR